MTSLDAPRSPGRDLAGGSAVARTGSFAALGHVFAVSCDDPALAAHVEAAFVALAVPGDPAGCYRIGRHHEHYDLHWGEEQVVGSTDLATVLGWLHWDVNRRAVAACDAELVLHAGCVALDGRAVVVCGAADAGKSTLVAALAAQRCDYLTDEAVPVDLATGLVRAYPRPLALDDRSLDLLPEIAPLRGPCGNDSHKRMVVFKPAHDHPPLEVAMVLFPERDPSGITVLEPISRADTIVRLAENAFNFPRHGRDAIDALAQMVQHADAYRGIGDDPRATASAVIDALATTDPSRTARPGGTVS